MTISPTSHSAVTSAILTEVAARFGHEFARIHHGLDIAGSPQRSLYRVVIEDGRGDPYVVERIAPQQIARRNVIARWLCDLRDRGLGCLAPYLADGRGAYIVSVHNSAWQMSPYVRGVPLPRPAWVHEGWRGEALARWWAALQRCSADLGTKDESRFDILAFAQDLLATLKVRDPALADRLDPVRAFLSTTLAPVHDRLPVAFCHGDLHPLNVIWGPRAIRAVIDWEFCGPKPTVYDIANLIGCIGIEEPQALGGEMVHAAITQLLEKNTLSDMSWAHLPPFVVAVRLAWLSEWLRQRDTEMVALEIDYLHLLIEHQEALYASWCIPRP